ncbi:putative thioesterase [Spinactinospora alkalitolerans]|uniref:Putative thioesterase n=1 Tax=Spinactinospora alkalitolerans TaxID=687207 RepID=A0A852TMC1_9ACTN|nr:thioesterase family protein [Spinactinospora alkalitolerans]NYE45426.1 putative thioesterase [Spinactinospora alkalitolerans]
MPIELAPGVTGTMTRTVEKEHCTTRGEHDILSTPNLVLFLEEAAIEVLSGHIGDHQSSVGASVDIAHTAPTLRGQTVSITAAVTEVDRRRVAFEITADDGVDGIASGRHERFIVDLDRFGARLDAKRDALR